MPVPLLESPFFWVGGLALTIWIYLLLGRGGFWRAGPLLPADPPAPDRWPPVAAIVPARNEADVIGRAVLSLVEQDYPGRISIVLVDDQSSDGTGEAARNAVAGHPHRDRLHLVQGRPLPPGWAGKVAAMQCGLETRADAGDRYYLFTDADIAHPADALRRLVSVAVAQRRALTSIMVQLHCRSAWEQLLIPPFVFFFRKLFPFAQVADDRSPRAGAAGGCMLVERTALENAGGLTAIRDAIIDDCALAESLKRAGGGLWLGHSRDMVSLRPYEGLRGIWGMVARSAFDQLDYSPFQLAGTVIGMALLYLAPPALVLGWSWHGEAVPAVLGAAAWALMIAAFLPTLRLYRQSGLWAPTLSLAGILYTLMTLDSARRHWFASGPQWKGRAVSRKPSDMV